MKLIYYIQNAKLKNEYNNLFLNQVMVSQRTLTMFVGVVLITEFHNSHKHTHRPLTS